MHVSASLVEEQSLPEASAGQRTTRMSQANLSRNAMIFQDSGRPHLCQQRLYAVVHDLLSEHAVLPEVANELDVAQGPPASLHIEKSFQDSDY